MRPRMAKLLVAGAGAIGSVFGGFLANAGHDVLLLGRAQHMEAVEREGLEIRGIWGRHRCSSLRTATAPGEWNHSFDAVLLTVKSYDTASLAPLVPRWLKPQGYVISLQNGLGNLEALAQHVPAERVLGGRVIFGAVVSAPGVVDVTVCAEPVRIGAFVPSAPEAETAVRHWVATISAAGIAALPCDSIIAELWSKAFYNAALNPLGALLRRTYGELAAHPETRAVMNLIIAEAFEVARAEGVPLQWGSAAEYQEHFYQRLVPPTANHRSSMLQDLARGKRTEIDAINGEIWRRGERFGVSTTANALLTRLIRAATS
ncbi:MAG: 2-dehydropantoate 2-reductase [Candidatus Binatia bacterium]|nr:MAG: 2-dehydropantoate 2-reductase [Candidatus Binatia bacterium]